MGITLGKKGLHSLCQCSAQHKCCASALLFKAAVVRASALLLLLCRVKLPLKSKPESGFSQDPKFALSQGHAYSV